MVDRRVRVADRRIARTAGIEIENKLIHSACTGHVDGHIDSRGISVWDCDCRARISSQASSIPKTVIV